QHPSTPYPTHPSSSGPHPPPTGAGVPRPTHPNTSGPHQVHPGTSGPHQVPPSTSGPHAVRPAPGGGPPARTQQSSAAPAGQRPASQGSDPVVSTWGPPQSARWARNDPSLGGGSAATTTTPQQPPRGRVGDVLESMGLEGESLAIHLLEVQDPADFLFGAGGYQLAEHERAIVVHSEFTNKGQVPFASLPDNYLEL